MPGQTLLMGAVAYDPKVVTIWDGFRHYLMGKGLPFDFVLYSHYERQVEDLVDGRIDAAWNSPLAWLRAQRLAAAQGRTVRSTVMRDTDQDLTSVVVVRADSSYTTLADLQGQAMASAGEHRSGRKASTPAPEEVRRGSLVQPVTASTRAAPARARLIGPPARR